MHRCHVSDGRRDRQEGVMAWYHTIDERTGILPRVQGLQGAAESSYGCTARRYRASRSSVQETCCRQSEQAWAEAQTETAGASVVDLDNHYEAKRVAQCQHRLFRTYAGKVE